MNMKTIAVCASALILGLCGCDSGSNGGAASGLATGPRTLDGALISVGLEQAPANKIVGEKKASVVAGMKDELPDDMKAIITKAGLDDAEIAWGALTLVDMEFDETGNPKGVPELIVTLAFDHDFDKFVAAVKEADAEAGKNLVKDTTVLGEKAFSVSEDDLTVVVTSLSGKLLVCATSEATAEKAVSLYRDGKGGSALAMDANTIFKAVVSSVGERIVKKLPVELYKDGLGPDEDATALFQGLKDVDATIAATADDGIGLTLKVGTASADDAAKVAALANEGLAGLKAMMTMMAAQDPEAKPAVDALNSVSVTADGAAINGNATVTGENFKKLLEKEL